MLADLDDPPKSRRRDLVVGLVVGLPVAAMLLGVFVPLLVRAVLGGAEGLDDRLRAQREYMATLCAGAFDEARDGALCNCVLATEHPGLDCQHRFLPWLLARQTDRCTAAAARTAHLSFCTCVDEVGRMVAAADDEPTARKRVQAYERCTGLPDALELPPLADAFTER